MNQINMKSLSIDCSELTDFTHKQHLVNALIMQLSDSKILKGTYTFGVEKRSIVLVIYLSCASSNFQNSVTGQEYRYSSGMRKGTSSNSVSKPRRCLPLQRVVQRRWPVDTQLTSYIRRVQFRLRVSTTAKKKRIHARRSGN